MNSLKFILLLCLSLAFAPIASADTVKSMSVTVYNNNRALVNEVRSMSIPQERSRMEFLGVPSTIEPQTLQVSSSTSPGKLRVLDMNYEYDLVNTKTLLDRFVGKEVNVILPDPSDATARILKKATLIANNGTPVFKVGDEIYVGPYESVLLKGLPEGLRARPTLVWLLDNQGPVKQDVEVSYLARGMSWRADYVLTLNRENTSAGLSGWVTLTNNTGMAYNSADLKLVAGDVHEATPPVRVYKTQAVLNEAATASGMNEESFFEYHLYSLDRPVDLADRQVKQVSLLQAPQITVHKELVSEYQALQNVRGEVKADVNVFVVLDNSEKAGLGMPLPKGIVRAYQQSSDGSKLLIGEDNIDHTAEGETVRLAMGKAFDVDVERKLAEYEKIGKNQYKVRWVISVRNGSDKAKQLILREYLPGTWDVLNSSSKYVKRDASGIDFVLTVPPTGTGPAQEVTYEAQIAMH